MSPVDWLVNQAAAGLEWEVDTTLDDVEEFFSILSEDQLNYLYMISERTDRIRDTAVMEYLMDRADNGLEWREVPEVLDMSLCHADFTYEYPFAHGNMFEAMSLYPAVVALD